MKFLSEIFGFESESCKATVDEDDAQPDDTFADVVHDISKTVRRKLSWCMFQAKKYRRRSGSQSRIDERRRMYERRHTIIGNELETTNNVVPKSHSENAISDCDANYASGQRRTRAASISSGLGGIKSKLFSRRISSDSIGKIDEESSTGNENSKRFSRQMSSDGIGMAAGISNTMDTKSKAYSRQISADNIGKINEVPKSGIPKSQSDGAIWTHLIPRVSKNEVQDRVATKLAARRQEICGMSSAQRVAYFRNKYGLQDNTN